MKQQLQNNREELISHIEAQLEFLKQQRNSLLNNPQSQQKDGKTNVTSYLRGKSQLDITTPSNADLFHSKTQLKEARQQARKEAEVLRQLYQQKRQLESIGIVEKDPTKIKKIFETEQTAKQIQSNLTKNKQRQAQKQARHKIIQEELSKAQLFLKQSKKTAKGKSLHSQYAYSQLLQGKQEKLKDYEQLLSRKKLTILQKEKLLEMTFYLIKEHTGKVPKNILEGFLLANQQFCMLFSITREQIMRDLKVHQTEQPGVLTYHQFYEFVKSVQITNKTIKPNLRYEAKAVRPATAKGSKQTLTMETGTKQFQEYIKKVYLYLDEKRQKIIERQRLVIALSKSLLFDEKKAKSLTKQTISAFSLFVTAKKNSAEKNYYKSLDFKYIGLEELLQLHRKFLQSTNLPTVNDQQRQSSSEEEAEFFAAEPAKDEFASPVSEEKEEQKDERSDFERYGWGQEERREQKFAQLSQLDAYYKQMSSKYGNEIHWNNHKVYQQDFKRFNQCIKQMKQNHSAPQQPIGLVFAVREEGQDLQSSQQL